MHMVGGSGQGFETVGFWVVCPWARPGESGHVPNLPPLLKIFLARYICDFLSSFSYTHPPLDVGVPGRPSRRP
jgi:hypothetical protein